MNLTNPSEIKNLMAESGFSFKKKFGQNFLINPEIPKRIATSSVIPGATKTACIEIGPGIGVMTAELSKLYDKVYSFEIDSELIPILDKTLLECENVTVINKDILDVNLKEFIEDNLSGYTVSVCANLPYYITTPIIMSLFESRADIHRIVVMIQKEVATRLTARAGSEEYGSITPTVEYYSEVKKLFEVAPGNFMPRPDVTSAVVSFDVRKTPVVTPLSEEYLFRTIRGAFALRRKTLINSLKTEFSSLSKEELTSCLESAGVSPSLRGETLSLKELSVLSDEIFKYLN
ncbi:MAG: 16S rRNA (adenine(1518)-N(6)/adenine(1519)-N(6))-dimethyltransferase RsmA [Ruminococcaceae bacterium]|nr:16S rRNA (adenine(1518)-N(6)/adenine(1519)-N(6))-dimethyltransferase RsmA [Oscillospiraceae bacterium]